MARRRNMKLRGNNSTFVLQVTSMVDMFTIILVFLLKSFSTSSVDITPSDKIKLPESVSQKDPIEALKLVVSKEAILIEDESIVELKNGDFQSKDLDKADRQFIRALYDKLDKHAEKSRDIASQNEEHKFKGQVIVQADSSLPYSVLKKVMYTSMIAGYADVKLAVVSME